MLHSKTHHEGLHHLWHIKVDKEILELGIFQLCVHLGKVLIGLSLIFHMIVNLDWNIWHVLLFYFFYQVGFVIMGLFSGSIINFLGIKHAIASRALGAIPYYLSLIFFLSENFWDSMLWIIPFAFFRATFVNASNVSVDAFLSRHLTQKSRGKTMAWMQIAIASSAVLGPILGGIVTAVFGFDYVAYIGMSVILLGGIVLLLTPDEKIQLPYTTKKILKDLEVKVPYQVYFAEYGRVFFDFVFWIVWPIFLVMVIGDIQSMGLLVGISSAMALLVAFFIGKSVDKSQKPLRSMINHGAFRSTALNFLRVLWLEPMFIAAIDSLSKINDQTIKTPYELEICQWISQKNSLERAHQRRIISESYYAVLMLFFTVIFFFFSEPPLYLFLAIFSLSALGLLLLSQITRWNLSQEI
jgi:MFS family permease